MADTFTVLPSSATGNVFLTEFTFQNSISSASSFAWDFGDSVYSYEGAITSHIYRYPGTYIVSSSAWNVDGSAPIVSQQSISVEYVYPNKVAFTQYPTTYSVPGQKTETPFVVSLTCTEIQDSLYLVLQSLNSNSTPIAYVPSKWQFITPKWQFVNAKTNEVITDGILVDTVPIYQTHNGVERVVAVSGQASFYYIDDVPTYYDGLSGSPLLLIATLSTENFVYPIDSQIYDYNSFANSDAAKAATLWQVENYFPTNLKVTENFISDIYPTKWTGVQIPTMVTLQFDSRLNQNFTGTQTITANLLGYPKTNDIGNAYPIVLGLTNNVSFTQETTALYFSNTDYNNNTNTGYLYTTITPTVSGTSTIVASTTCIEPFAIANDIGFNFPYGYPIYSNAFVYNPYSSTINKFGLVNCPNTNKYIQYYKDLGVLSDGKLDVWNIPTPSTTETNTPQTTSSAPLYGIALDPILNVVYTCDPVNQTISSFNQVGDLNVDPVNLFYVLGEGESANPCCISIDGNHNVWLSLYNEETLVKLDSNLNFVCEAEPSTYVEEVQLITPPILETDLNNNVWACYAEVSANYLVQFGLSGEELQNISLPISSVPVSLAIDSNNSVWVACYNSNTILNFLSSGELNTVLQGDFTRPNYLSVDSHNNIWFTHGYNFISKFDLNSSSLDSWQFDVEAGTCYYTTETEPIVAIPSTNEMWAGLSIDVYDRVWAIDSKTNNVIVFNRNDPFTLRIVSAQPALSTIAISLPTPISGIDIPTSHIHSSQAVGDWTGNKWYQKYATPIYTASIGGESTPFTVFNLDGSYSVAKVNEEFDISAYFQSLALPETLSRNNDFFQKFLAAVAGDGNPTTESAGRVIYERIANFIQTHGDFETAEIDQLLSYAAQLSVATKTYGIDFPAEINRLINLFSVPKKSLRGRINYDPNPNNNIGPVLTYTDTVSAGQYLFARNKTEDAYQLVYVTPLADGTEVYPLSSLIVAGFATPLENNYYFFQYIQNTLGYTENIINWDSIYTTFDYTLSSNEEWYGDNGLIEKMFNNILTKRLTE